MNRNTDKRKTITDRNTTCPKKESNINFRADIRKFTEIERETIKAARKVTGTDRPTFYHDGIVAYAERIVKENNNA